MATLEAVAETAKPEQNDSKPKRQPPHAVVVHNDDDHTFAYVIETFLKVLRYPIERCTQLAEQIHRSGRAIVWSGSKEVAELKRDQLRGAGPDHYAVETLGKPVTYALAVTIEEMP